jgi:hypothetical protein
VIRMLDYETAIWLLMYAILAAMAVWVVAHRP